MTKIMEIEKIQTGLSKNYVGYWGVEQALKEAMQNIAYGSIKAEHPAKVYFDSIHKMTAIRDYYKGFDKSMLYIGESEQRDDKDGLGNFGEGWKIFLLVMAREGIKHMVRTVGFDFWGKMETTTHGTEVLVIYVRDNDKTNGTKVLVDLPEDMVKNATKSFAVLQGIDKELTTKNTVLPDRRGELWVQGVRIEDKDNTNPLNLFYSYNITHRDLINRDRSHVNTELAYYEIKKIIFEMDEDFIKDYVNKALAGKQQQDILRGMYVPGYSHPNKETWLKVLADLHACEPSQLVIPSYNNSINDQAKKQGYVLLDTPKQWAYEIEYLGIRKADDIVSDSFDVVETSYSWSSKEEKTAFSRAKRNVKKALQISSVDDLPAFRYVSSIKAVANDGMDILVKYDQSLRVIYVSTSIMSDERLLTKHILKEALEWYNEAYVEYKGHLDYEEIVLNLLMK